MNNEIISLHSHPEWRIPAARWFQEKWGIPLEEYLTSIDECIEGRAAVPQWYIMTDGGRIIAGAGVIANDFHDRKDLTPNVCALYVEPELRCRGIVGQLLAHICKDMAAKGIGTLYLVTEHTSFYERYGWEYLCMVQGDDGEQMRMYISQHVRSSMSTRVQNIAGIAFKKDFSQQLRLMNSRRQLPAPDEKDMPTSAT